MSKISLIDINSVFWADDINLLIDKDTLHPNTLGHQLVFEMVLASLI
jgi:lysophospholipase L1-like esterase